MKHIVALSMVLALSGVSVAHAGNMKAPAMEKPIIVETAKAGSSSSAMTLVALTGIFMFAVVAAR